MEYQPIGSTGTRRQPAAAWLFHGMLIIGIAMVWTIPTQTQKYSLAFDASDRSPMEADATVPSAWVLGAKADASKPITLHFAIKNHPDVDLAAELQAVSQPGHARYGQHFSKSELDELSQPHSLSTDAVYGWLSRQGLKPTRTSLQDFVQVHTTIGQAEALLHSQYHEFSTAKGHSVVRTTSYTVPAAVRDHLDFVAPTVQFPGVRPSARNLKRVSEAELKSSTYSYITPSELQSMYGVEGITGGGNTNNSQAITAFLDEYYCDSDLQKFYNKFLKDNAGFEIESEIGSTTDDHPGCGDEANLDVQYMTAMSEQVPTKFWSFAGYSPDVPQVNEPFLDFMLYLNAQENPPWVVSTSYGEDEGSTSLDYAKRVQGEFMKAGLRGVSLLFASGDSGVASIFHQSSCEQFTPQWPAGSPWVTAVGATSGVDTETAADFSSGGFSNRWSMPEYQKSSVLGFLESQKDRIQEYIGAEYLPTSLYTANGTEAGRAFPDVSAAGSDFLVVIDGTVYSVDGTSASTPVFAGVVSLVNEQRALAGKKPLGFLNPMIYQFGDEMFNDITDGTNPGCGTDGFEAIAGWDAVTGFGTPNYQKFVEVALELP